MTTALQVVENSPAQWEGKLDLITRTVANGATKDELDLFLYQARRAGLDPLARQIYFVKRSGKGTIQVGIDGLRLIADRTGAYAGNDDPVFVDGNPFPEAATVTVWKMVGGQRCPFAATARWKEYYPGDQQGFQWKKMPHVMLAKCAEALALRKAFPQDMSGLYVHEEMDQAGSAPLQAAPPADKETGEIIEAQVVEDAPPPQQEERVRGEVPSAFGYSPEKWPFFKSFEEPPSEKQQQFLAKMLGELNFTGEEVEKYRTGVLLAFGVDSAVAGSKGAHIVLLDFMTKAPQEAKAQALQLVDPFAE
jgi:phage recombination protein Bet